MAKNDSLPVANIDAIPARSFGSRHYKHEDVVRTAVQAVLKDGQPKAFGPVSKNEAISLSNFLKRLRDKEEAFNGIEIASRAAGTDFIVYVGPGFVSA